MSTSVLSVPSLVGGPTAISCTAAWPATRSGAPCSLPTIHFLPPCTPHQVVCAGSKDSFQIFVWSLKTGRLLDVLAAHEGPVIALGFCPGASLLASASWDR